MSTVVIDPGHGGAAAVGGSSPNNAAGPNGLLEKDVTLDLARRVSALLANRATVILTRTTDTNLALADRAKIAHDNNADIFLSIHLNGWKDPSVDGSEAWIATQASAPSRTLARSLLDQVIAVTRARDRGVKQQDFGVLLPQRLASNTAAALLEVAFLTNPDEANKLSHDDYKQQIAQAIATALTAQLHTNGAVAQSLATPDQKTEAIAIVNAFRAEIMLGAFTPGRDDVADRAIALINDPTLVDQASLNLCGPAAAHRLWIARNPRAFARYVTTMYDTGEADFGTKHIKAGSDLRDQPYDGKAVPAMRAAGSVCPSADWVAMSALRDSSNTFLDFEGMPDEDVAGLTTPAELAAWLRATGLYGSVDDEGNWFFTKGLGHAEGLRPDGDTDIAILINAHILTSSGAAGHKKSDDFVLNAFPNHFVVLLSPITEPTPDEVEFDCWTWGSNVHVRVPQSVFKANYYGAVIAHVPIPVSHTSSFALEAAARVDGIHPSVHDARLPSWADMTQDGVLYAIHRASEQTNWTDPLYPDRYKDARANRAIFGAFHFSTWKDQAGAATDVAHAPDYFRRQADNLIGVVGRVLPGDLAPTLDFESKTVIGSPWNGAAWRDPLEAFLDRVETAFGRVPMIYTGKSLWDEHVDQWIARRNEDARTFARFAEYPLWVIRVYNASGSAGNFDNRLTRENIDIPSPWSDWEIWQYDGSESGEPSSSGRFPHFAGVAGSLDVDVSRGNIHRLRGLTDLGTPAAYGDQVRAIAYADENGEIKVLYNLGFQLEANVTELSGGFKAVGDVAGCEVGGSSFLAFRSRADDHVYELAGDVATPQGTPTAPTDVTGSTIGVGDPTYVTSGGDRALVYWGSDDHLYVAVNIAGTWQATLDVNNGAGIADIATGNAALYVSGGDLHIVGRMGRSGHLFDAALRGAFQPGSQWDRSPVDITDRAGAPAATYKPTTYTTADGSVRIVYRALRGHIHEIDQAFTDTDLSQQSGAPTCAGNPSAFFVDGRPHVVYRRSDGLLQEIAGDGAGGFTTAMLPCAEAAADPAVSVTADGVFVVFRGRDGGFHQATFKAGAWQCAPLGPNRDN